MGKLSSFTFITLNGFYKGPDEDISWHRHQGEEESFAEEGASSQSTLLFGRKTYEMMASFWPTPMAMEMMPGVAEGMNKSPKVVFSRTLDKVDWENTTLIKDHMLEEVRRLKAQPDSNLTVLGSGQLLAQLAEAGLVDEFQIMVDPVVLGAGTSLFQLIGNKLDLELTGSKIFSSGVVLLSYQALP